MSTSDDGRRQIARPSTSRSYSKWSTTERNKIIDHILNSPNVNVSDVFLVSNPSSMILNLFCPQWALNSSVTALAMKGLVLEGRTTDQIRKKALEILKKFKISYKKRNSPGNSSGLPVVHRYEELAKACGDLVQLPLLMGSEGNERTGRGDRSSNDPKRNLPPTPGRSRPLSSPHPIPSYGQELGQLEDNNRLQNGQDYIIAVRDLEERQADRLLRERELEERVKLRELKERQLQFEIRKWESGRK